MKGIEYGFTTAAADVVSCYRYCASPLNTYFQQDPASSAAMAVERLGED